MERYRYLLQGYTLISLIGLTLIIFGVRKYLVHQELIEALNESFCGSGSIPTNLFYKTSHCTGCYMIVIGLIMIVPIAAKIAIWMSENVKYGCVLNSFISINEKRQAV